MRHDLYLDYGNPKLDTWSDYNPNEDDIDLSSQPAPSLKDFCAQLTETLRHTPRSSSDDLPHDASDAPSKELDSGSSWPEPSIRGQPPYLFPPPWSLADDTFRRNRSFHNLEPLRYLGLQEWRVWWVYHYDKSISTVNNIDGPWSPPEMLRLLRIFSQIFLPEPLPAPHCGLGFTWSASLLNDNDGKSGRCRHMRHAHVQEGQLLVTMVLDPSDRHEETGTEDHVTHMISMVLHEMMHGFLMSYCCDGKHDDDGSGKAGNVCTRRGKALWVEGRYHCRGWFSLACTVESAMRRLTGLDVNLVCFGSYIDDVERKGATPISARGWENLFEDVGWEGAKRLFARMHLGQSHQLRRILARDRMVMEVWDREAEKAARREM